MQCVIIAGGLASRLRPITDNIPKSMVLVENRPFLEYQIELLKDNGISNIVLCVGHKGEIIQNYFGNGSNYNIQISYSYEETLLGTGGALRNAIDLLEDRFVVLYGDTFLNIDYIKIINYVKKIDCPALLAVYKNEGKYDTSNVIYSDGKVVLYDKKKSNKEMQYIDSGLSILTKRIISQCIPKGIVHDLGDCYNELSNKNQLAGYKVTKRFYEIGSKSGLKEFKKYVKRKETEY